MLQLVLDVCKVIGRYDGRLLFADIGFETCDLCRSDGRVDAEIGLVSLHEAVLFLLDGFLAFVNREVMRGNDLPVAPGFADVELEYGMVVAWHVPADDE